MTDESLPLGYVGVEEVLLDSPPHHATGLCLGSMGFKGLFNSVSPSGHFRHRGQFSRNFKVLTD